MTRSLIRIACARISIGSGAVRRGWCHAGLHFAHLLSATRSACLTLVAPSHPVPELFRSFESLVVVSI